MYEPFFDLREPAFSLTPDPELLWPSETHREGVATLIYGITHRKGFLLLTGDVGVGKTTVLQAALDALPDGIDTAVVFNTTSLTPEALLQIIAREFRLPVEGGSKVEILNGLNQHLSECAMSNRIPVLLIDEAQNLEPDLLEEVRLLSNFETRKQKLLQIVLIGQPELREMLARPEMRPLRQRIALAHRVEPLKLEEIRPYLAYRLARAGGDIDTVFKPGVEVAFHTFSRGYPRLINVLADRILLAAATHKLRPVTVEFLQDKTAELLAAGSFAVE